MTDRVEEIYRQVMDEVCKNPLRRFAELIAADERKANKREWVSLTDEEIAKAVGSPIDEVYLNDFRKVEAKLKEKNT